MKRRHAPVDWDEVTRLIRLSVRGKLSPHFDMSMCVRALEEDSVRYKKLHAELKEEAGHELQFVFPSYEG